MEMEKQEFSKEIEELSFREAMSELDGVVEKLESGSLELEESLKLYERGVGLITNLRSRLTCAQQEVEQLMDKLSGVVDDEEQDTTLS